MVAHDLSLTCMQCPELCVWHDAGARISITLRCVGTFLRHDPDGVRVYGQGAVHSTEEKLDTAVANGHTEAGRVSLSEVA